MNNNQNDLGESFEKLKKEISFTFKGCTIYRCGSGFKWAGAYYNTMEELTVGIEKTYRVLGNTLVIPPKRSLYRRFMFWLLGK